MGGPQAWSGRERQASPPPVFDPRTVQAVASRCTDWVIAAQYILTPAKHWYNALTYSGRSDYVSPYIYTHKYKRSAAEVTLLCWLRVTQRVSSDLCAFQLICADVASTGHAYEYVHQMAEKTENNRSLQSSGQVSFPSVLQPECMLLTYTSR